MLTLGDTPPCRVPMRFRWRLDAQADAFLSARVLALFTVRNEVPRYFCARQLDAGRLRIDVEAAVESEQSAVQLAHRLRAIPSVDDVALERTGL